MSNFDPKVDQSVAVEKKKLAYIYVQMCECNCNFECNSCVVVNCFSTATL